MTITSTDQYRTSLAYRSRLRKMRDVAGENLTPINFAYFDQSVRPLLDEVESEIKAYESESCHVTDCTWRNLGEFVVSARILRPPDRDISWNALECPVNVSITSSVISSSELALFQIPATTVALESCLGLPMSFGSGLRPRSANVGDGISTHYSWFACVDDEVPALIV